MKKILSLFFVLSISTGPVLAFGWGSDCPYSKENASQERTEKVEESEK